MLPIHKATVAGSGMMGPGIAATLALAGIPTTLLSRTEARAWHALSTAREQIMLLENDAILTKAQSDSAIELLDSSFDFPTAMEGRDLIIESIPEDMATKQDWIEKVEAIVSPTAIITSNTSGLSITGISSRAAHPERIATTHFWNPAHLMPLVEIVRSPSTNDITVQTLEHILNRAGKVTVVVNKDRPGQLGNRLQMALVREAVNIIAEGIASVEDVDRAASLGFGLRLPVYGIFEHADLVGLDMSSSICDYVSRDLYSHPQAPDLYKQIVRAGQLGAKTGKGFYDWSTKDADQVRYRRDRWLREFLKGPFGEKLRPQQD